MTIEPDILRVARSVRTSDLSDALDSMGLQERYVMRPEMRPLFPGIRFAGLARTAEYEIADRPLEAMSYIKDLSSVDLAVLEQIVRSSHRTLTAGTYGGRASDGEPGPR